MYNVCQGRELNFRWTADRSGISAISMHPNGFSATYLLLRPAKARSRSADVQPNPLTNIVHTCYRIGHGDGERRPGAEAPDPGGERAHGAFARRAARVGEAVFRRLPAAARRRGAAPVLRRRRGAAAAAEIGRASCRERV